MRLKRHKVQVNARREDSIGNEVFDANGDQQPECARWIFREKAVPFHGGPRAFEVATSHHCDHSTALRHTILNLADEVSADRKVLIPEGCESRRLQYLHNRARRIAIGSAVADEEVDGGHAM